MSKTVITGRIFEKILTKSGYNRADYARFVSKNDRKRNRQWASALILKYSREEVPERWVKHLREMIGEEQFGKLVKELAGGGLGDAASAKPQLTAAETERRLEAVRERFTKAVIPERLELLDSLPYEG